MQEGKNKVSIKPMPKKRKNLEEVGWFRAEGKTRTDTGLETLRPLTERKKEKRKTSRRGLQRPPKRKDRTLQWV